MNDDLENAYAGLKEMIGITQESVTVDESSKAAASA